MLPDWIMATIWKLAAVGGLGLLCYSNGLKAGQMQEQKLQIQENSAIEATRKAAIDASVEAIKKIGVQHVTVNKTVERTIKEVPVYRDCRHDERMFNTINEALTGHPAKRASESDVPAFRSIDR
jgi:hypothetical protein